MKRRSKEVLYLSLDVHDEDIAAAIAEAGRDGELRNYGEIANTFHSIGRITGIGQEGLLLVFLSTPWEMSV